MATYHFSNKPHATLKSGEKMNVKTHYEYICREGKYGHMKDRSEEKLIAVSSGNLPYWTYDRKKGGLSAKKFWTEAEKQRIPSQRGYRELRIALMEEFTPQENIQLVETFLQRSGIKDAHAYSYAIHDKTAAFNKNHHNIHVHIMFNEKIIEKDRPLPADQFFKKYSVRKNGELIGGYKTSRYFSAKSTTVTMRQLWEDIVNEKFQEKGLPQRVSCKTLEEQKEEAEENHNYLLADRLDRKSAPNIGSLYRNAKNMSKINMLVQEFSKAIEDPAMEDTLERTIAGLEDTVKDRRLIIFAQDLALRNSWEKLNQQKTQTLEQAQEQTQQLLQEQEKERREKELLAAPWAVTSDDIVFFIQQKQEAKKKEIDSLISKYNSITVLPMKKEDAVEKAINIFTKGEYEKLKTDLDNINQREKEYEEKGKELIKDTSANAAETYAQFLQEQDKLEEESKKKSNEMKKLEEALAIESTQETIQKLSNEIWQGHLQTQREKQKALQEVARAQNEQMAFDLQVNQLTSKPKEMYYHEGNLPEKVTYKSLFNGLTPVRTLPTFVDKGTKFIVTNKENDEGIAIKMNEVTSDGNAKSYAVKFLKNEENGKEKITEDKPLNELIPLFQGYKNLIFESAKNSWIKELLSDRLKLIQAKVEEEYNRIFSKGTGEKRSKEKGEERGLELG